MLTALRKRLQPGDHWICHPSLLSLIGMSLPIPGFSVPTLLDPTTSTHSFTWPPSASTLSKCWSNSTPSDQMGHGYLIALAHYIVWVLSHFWESHESRWLHKGTHTILYTISDGSLTPWMETSPWNHIRDLRWKTPALESQKVIGWALPPFSIFSPYNIGVSDGNTEVDLYSSFCTQNSTAVSRHVLKITWHDLWNLQLFLLLREFSF